MRISKVYTRKGDGGETGMGGGQTIGKDSLRIAAKIGLTPKARFQMGTTIPRGSSGNGKREPSLEKYLSGGNIRFPNGPHEPA